MNQVHPLRNIVLQNTHVIRHNDPESLTRNTSLYDDAYNIILFRKYIDILRLLGCVMVFLFVFLSALIMSINHLKNT
jgi:hypothetical protein